MQVDAETKRKAEDHPEEEAQKSYGTIQAQQIEQGAEELNRPARGLLLSSFAAGLEIGIGPFLMAVILTLTGDVYPHATTELLMAAAYSVGFIVVVLGRSELFTEHTSLALQSVLARQASVVQLLRLWGLVFVANVVGATIFSAFAAYLGPALGVAEPDAFGEIARRMVDDPAGTIFLGGVMAGWMVGLLAWLITAGRDTTGQILVAGLLTGGIALAHLHHSIAGTVEVLLGVFAGAGATPADFARFLLWSTLGNIAGGSVLVALVKYGHVRQGSA